MTPTNSLAVLDITSCIISLNGEVVNDGSTFFNHFVHAKLAAWDEYDSVVHSWELERYLARY